MWGWMGGLGGRVGRWGGMREADTDRGSLSTASVGGTGLKTGFNSISFRI